jgi:protein TonB
MRFAELGQVRSTGELTAPVAVSAVHPAYPTDLIRDHVEGTVVLYAVIHSDGSVGDVRVLHGVDDRLDANACSALEKWRFRPGTKNGSAVDIEAVVQIPFVASRKLGF